MKKVSGNDLVFLILDVEVILAKDWVKNLQGNFRLPDIVNQVDKLIRQF